MNQLPQVSGIELRYLLTTYLFDHGHATVDELVQALTYQGIEVCIGRIAVGDVARPSGPRAARPIRAGRMPRATEFRIDQRVKALRAKVAEMSLRAGQEGCCPDFPAAG